MFPFLREPLNVYDLKTNIELGLKQRISSHRQDLGLKYDLIWNSDLSYLFNQKLWEMEIARVWNGSRPKDLYLKQGESNLFENCIKGIIPNGHYFKVWNFY